MTELWYVRFFNREAIEAWFVKAKRLRFREARYFSLQALLYKRDETTSLTEGKSHAQRWKPGKEFLMQVSFSILENHSFRTVEQTLNLVLFLCCLGKKLLQLMYCPINIFPIYFSLVKFIFYFLWNDSITFSSTMLSLATQRMLFRIICSRGCQIVLVERTLTVEEQTFNHDNQPTTMAMIPRGYLLILHYHMPPEWFVILISSTPPSLTLLHTRLTHNSARHLS